MSEFVEFPKIARLSRPCVITEKIDGTNAQVCISSIEPHVVGVDPIATRGPLFMYAGSRNKYLRPGRDGVKGEDNFGFAGWVLAHAEELWALGEGRHFGEWWGSGIQRGYGLQKGEKRFSLFNVARWADQRDREKFPGDRPACCHVVPQIGWCNLDSELIGHALQTLREHGSQAAPGFMNPEGIVIFHTASGQLFKKTLEKDDEPKSGVRR